MHPSTAKVLSTLKSKKSKRVTFSDFPTGEIVDGKKLKANRWYIVESGEWVEVDFSDGIFSYVLSHKSGVKKVKTEKGEILFVVSDENGNSAHGNTIKEAREDLVYKVVAKFEGEIPKNATGKE